MNKNIDTMKSFGLPYGVNVDSPNKLDGVINPGHYKQHPSGIECIQITEHFNLNLGSAIKYIWRSDYKGTPTENLSKAMWHLQREIKRLEGKNGS